MTEHHTRIGIDLQDDHLLCARVEYASGRPDVRAMTRLEQHELPGHPLAEGGRVVLSLPDEHVIMKRLRLGEESGDIDAHARFELSQCVMDDTDLFLFDVIPVGTGDRYLGLILRRELLDRSLDRLGEEGRNGFADACYQVRAAALADGYVEFCRPAGGDFVCLIDFMDRAVSIAFVHKGRIVDLAGLPRSQADLNSPEEVDKTAVEIKTLANYRINTLFKDGITTPLSSLLVSGQGCCDGVLETLGKYFSVEIGRPRLNTGFFSAETGQGDPPLEHYLVALGLTAN